MKIEILRKSNRKERQFNTMGGKPENHRERHELKGTVRPKKNLNYSFDCDEKLHTHVH